MKLMLDSGAPSLYNYLVRKKQTKGIMGSFLKDRVNDTFEFLETKDYREYKKEYVDFLQKNAHYFDTYVNLDIINNAEATWQNQLELESYGLKPIPVFHFGSDRKYLYKYLERGHDYIAMGGFIPNPVSMLQQGLDDLWANVLCDGNGFPKVKVHGFAVTSARLASRYPWYSVDSTSWAKIGIYGAIVIPRLDVDGDWIFDGSPNVIFVSNKSKAKDEVDGKHIDTVSGVERESILRYLKSQGVALGKSSYKDVGLGYVLKEGERWSDVRNKVQVEIVEEQGVSNQFELRNKINLLFFIGLQKSRPGWPWEFGLTIPGFDLDESRDASEKARPGLSQFYEFPGSWRLYIAGENPHGVDPNTPRGSSDKDIYNFMQSQGIEMCRLVSNYYKGSVYRNMELKKELEAA